MKPGIIFAFIIIVVDQLSKFLLLAFMKSHNYASVEIISFFNLVMVWNRGISFGILHGFKYAPHLLIVMTTVVIFALIWWVRVTENRFTNIAAGLILGGAAANLIDRLRFGAVADFFDFHLAGYHWPAFNIADAAICIGASFIIISQIFTHQK